MGSVMVCLRMGVPPKRALGKNMSFLGRFRATQFSDIPNCTVSQDHGVWILQVGLKEICKNVFVFVLFPNP